MPTIMYYEPETESPEKRLKLYNIGFTLSFLVILPAMQYFYYTILVGKSVTVLNNVQWYCLTQALVILLVVCSFSVMLHAVV